MGLLRLFLATLVVIYHTRVFAHGAELAKLPTIPLIPIPDAYTALCLFFTMSGFYMAMILNRKYPEQALELFYVNRFLRIWPTYVFSLFFIGVLIWKTDVVCATACITPEQLKSFFMQIPELARLGVILSNLFVFGLDAQWGLHLDAEGASFAAFPSPQTNGPLFALNMPMWSVAAELTFYMTAPFIVRSWKRSLAVMLAALLWHVAWGPQNTYQIFQFAPALFLYFSLGTLTYQLSSKFASLLERRTLQIGAFIFVYLIWNMANLPLFHTPPAQPIGLHTYIRVLGFLPALPFLFHLTARSSFDRFCADLSYPFFVLHGPIFIYSLWGIPLTGNSLTVFVLLASLVAGLIGYLLIERPVGTWRERWTEKQLAKLQR